MVGDGEFGRDSTELVEVEGNGRMMKPLTVQEILHDERVQKSESFDDLLIFAVVLPDGQH